MSQSKKLILNGEQIGQIIRRIAYQIYENNLGEKELVFAGISKLGHDLAMRIVTELKIIEPKLSFTLFQIDLDKEHPRGTVLLSDDVRSLEGKSVILVDDVLNTGKTLTYSLMALLETDISKIEVAVLVDRGHPQFPVSSTFTGYQLATTLNEHIEVKLGKKPGVYLY